jgi:hypothetical protein
VTTSWALPHAATRPRRARTVPTTHVRRTAGSVLAASVAAS